MTTDTLQCVPLTFPHVKLNSTAVNIGASVAVSCDTGFMPVGGSTLVTCLGSGAWSSKIPLCVADPNYIDESTKQQQTIIISITAVGCAVALAVLLCACYMLIGHRKRKAIRDAQSAKTDDDKSCVSEPFAIRQDCVGMPAVVFTNMNPTLTGKQSQGDDDGDATNEHAMRNPQEKNFCY